MKTCSVCGGTYNDSMRFCPADGAVLNDERATEPAIDRLIGMVLADRYRVIKRLGEGGMGAVYLAENIHAEMSVALKILNKRASQDPILLKRFEEERRIISKLRHPNILKLLDSFHTDDGELVVVIEYVNGVTLEERIQTDGISPKETLYILGEVFDALSEAHEANIIHRDLKPSNLMLEEVGDRLVVKVLDFGIAKTLSSTGMTNTGITLGTPAYMSPEQVQGIEIDARSDLYSMGCVGYQCLAGRPPFEGENPFSIIRQHIKDVPASLTGQLPALDVSPEVQAFIFRLLAKEPDDRFPDARHARNAARALEGGAPTAPRVAHTSSSNIADAPTMAPDEAGGIASAATAPEAASQPGALLTDTPPYGIATEDPDQAGRSPQVLAVALVALILGLGAWFLLGSDNRSSNPSQPSKQKTILISGQSDNEDVTKPTASPGVKGKIPVAQTPSPSSPASPTAGDAPAPLVPTGSEKRPLPAALPKQSPGAKVERKRSKRAERKKRKAERRKQRKARKKERRALRKAARLKRTQAEKKGPPPTSVPQKNADPRYFDLEDD